MVPVVGLEPTRCRHQRILSPSRLPIPSHRHEFSSKITTLEIGGHFGGQTSKIKNVRFSKAQIFRAVPGSEGEMTKGILSPPRLPIPSFRQICYLKIGFSEIGGRFGGRFWKNAAIQFLKSPKLLVFLDFTRRSAQLILSPSRLPIPSFRPIGLPRQTV